MGFGGFYKGEKKKSKKGGKNKAPSVSVPTFTMPEIVSKKKKPV